MAKTDRWLVTLAPSRRWQDAYPDVERIARWALAQHPERTYSTNDLVHALWPINPQDLSLNDELRKTHSRLYRALAGLAQHSMSDCATKGIPREIGNTKRMGQPLIWHHPVSTDTHDYVSEHDL